MPSLVIKTCCWFKQSEYLQAVLEPYANNGSTGETLNEGEEIDAKTIETFTVGEIVNYRVY